MLAEIKARGEGHGQLRRPELRARQATSAELADGDEDNMAKEIRSPLPADVNTAAIRSQSFT
ncbi:hypothetical protein [Mesorhizobium sp. Cs1299R1N3]|uniref:hypothetical protein n=1 Tax=Mesorhizobium sp. Cs1299R1N3 TaxID=3015173 RepID=UPI00301DFB81